MYIIIYYYTINNQIRWTIQVGNTQETIKDYIVSEAKENNGTISIKAQYFGSGTRVSDETMNGVVFDLPDQLFYPPIYRNEQGKYIRVLNSNKEIIIDTYISGQQFVTLKSNDLWHSVTIPEVTLVSGSVTSLKFMLRDLHRLENYPFEISGIQFSLN